MLFKKRSPLKILFVGSECIPYTKVGGLGQVLYSLPRALNNLGHDARVMIPLYLGIDKERFPMEMAEEKLEIPSGGEEPPIICNIKRYTPAKKDKESPAITYFLENQEYYEKRANVYGYADDPVRWALLCRSVLEFIRFHHKTWKPDIIVSTDWQGGLIPNYLNTDYKDDRLLKDVAVAFSIHNIFYQGNFDHHFVTEMEFDSGESKVPSLYAERLLKLNFMRRGIRYADVINTVSPTYAREITTKEYGEGLEDLLSERRSRLFGILNGIDYNVRNPETDEHIEQKYTKDSLDKRLKNKLVLQKTFNLPEDENVFIVGITSRLTEQKGFDLLFNSAKGLMENFNLQFIVLGEGDGKNLSFFQELRDTYPEKVAVHLSYDEILGHVVHAGADAILIPSRFEPSGLVQMEAMRYGAIPIVRATGGLADSVEDYNPVKQTGTGFSFKNYDSYALFGTIIRALETYHSQESWRALQKRAMEADFSWENSAREYVKMFHKALEFNYKENNG